MSRSRNLGFILLVPIAAFIIILLGITPASASPDAPACTSPTIIYLGEGPGVFNLPTGYDGLIAKVFHPARLEIHYGQQSITLTKKTDPHERAWAIKGQGATIELIYNKEVPIGDHIAGTIWSATLLDDDGITDPNGNRPTWIMFGSTPVITFTNISLSERVTVTLPHSGTYTIKTMDSIGIVCPSAVAPPTGTPTPTPTPDLTETEIPTATTHVTATTTPTLAVPTTTATVIGTSTGTPTPTETPVIVTPPSAPAAIGNFVWFDRDLDNLQNINDEPIQGVNVALYQTGGILVGRTQTGADGHYIFGDLVPGDYHLVFGAPIGLVLCKPDQGTHDGADSDVRPDGSTAQTSLSESEIDLDWDACFQPIQATALEEEEESSYQVTRLHLPVIDR